MKVEVQLKGKGNNKGEGAADREMKAEAQQQRVATGWTYVEGQDLHRGVEQFVSWMFNVSTAEEKPEHTKARGEEHLLLELLRCSTTSTVSEYLRTF